MIDQTEMRLWNRSELSRLGAEILVDPVRRYATIRFGHWTLPRVTERLRVVWRNNGEFDVAAPGFSGDFRNSYQYVMQIPLDSDWLAISRMVTTKQMMSSYRFDARHASCWASLIVYARRLLRKIAREQGW